MPRLKPTVRSPRERRYRRRGGPWDVPNLDLVLTDATPRPDVLVDGDRRLDSATVNEQVARLAGGLRQRGARRRDVVAWQAPNWYESVLLYRACWRLGAIAVPIHHRAGPAEVEAMLAQVEPRVVLTDPERALARRPGALLLRSGDTWDELLDADAILEPGARADDVACVLFTSGSTGEPKAVIHTQRALAGKARSMGAVHGLTTEDAVLMPAPLAHVSGLLNGVLVPGAVPMKTVLASRWDPAEASSIIGAERITFMVGPPTFFVQLMDAPGFVPDHVATLRLISSGGAGVTPAFVERAGAVLGATVKRTYGSTEAPTVTTSRAGDDPARAASTDGRAAPDVEVRIVDPATGDDRPDGEPGELWVRGPEVCGGYVDATRTAEAFAPGAWFRTGDLAVLDGGWVTIVGRLKDVIIRGGENISASEVEAVLEAHPAIRQAVAIGQPDDTMGERVVAVVVAAEPFDLAACRAWFAERGVARYKTPERVVRVDDLPLLPSGKPDRTRLRALIAESDR